MIDEKWEEEVMAMSKHKLLEAVEKLNKESYHSAEDIRKYKDAFKVYINVTAEISNTNFGLGKLFPTTK